MQPGIYTIILVGLTVLTSIKAFSDGRLYDNFIFAPGRMSNNPREYYRFLSHGFIHGNWPHLIFNMLALWSFGDFVEGVFAASGIRIAYLLLYLTGIVAASVPSYYKHRHDRYSSLGASGGVAAIVFAGIAINPWSGIGFLFLPFAIPGVVFGALYLIFSAYMARRGDSHIDHDAHFWGSVYGFVFTFIALPGSLQSFIYQMQHPGAFGR